MNKNFTFKELYIDELQEILAEIANFQSNIVSLPGKFRIIDTESTLAALPILTNWFNKNSLVVKQIAYISCAANTTQEVHLDSGNNELALNFPVINCENVTTDFFEYKEQNLTLKYTIGTNLPYLFYDIDGMNIISSFSLVKPTILNIKMPHRVVNNTELERISISFRFMEDPWKLV
jgi:hypothetical protein